MSELRFQAGFTIIELLITISLIGVIAAFAIPAFNTLTANNRVVATTNEISGLLAAARAEAVKQAAVVRVGPRAGADWSSGLAAWIDQNSDSTMQDAEILRQTSAISGSLTFAVVNAGSAGFRANGRTVNWQAGTNATFTVCSSDATSGRQIVLTPGGRSNSSTVNCP